MSRYVSLTPPTPLPLLTFPQFPCFTLLSLNLLLPDGPSISLVHSRPLFFFLLNSSLSIYFLFPSMPLSFPTANPNSPLILPLSPPIPSHPIPSHPLCPSFLLHVPFASISSSSPSSQVVAKRLSATSLQTLISGFLTKVLWTCQHTHSTLNLFLWRQRGCASGSHGCSKK